MRSSPPSTLNLLKSLCGLLASGAFLSVPSLSFAQHGGGHDHHLCHGDHGHAHHDHGHEQQRSRAISAREKRAPSKAWQRIIDRCDPSTKEHRGAAFAATCLDADVFERLSAHHQDQLLKYADRHRNGNAPLTICWQEDTPFEVVDSARRIEAAGAAVQAATEGEDEDVPIGAAFQGVAHWSTTAIDGPGQNFQGRPVTLTWSFVPDGTTIPGGEVTGEPVNGSSNLRARLAAIYGGDASGPAASQPWFPLFQSVFDNIAAQTGMRYVYEPNDDGATLSNGAPGILGTRGDVRISGHTLDGNSNVLAYNYFPSHGDMVIDTNDNFYDNTGNNSLRLRNVVEHEHGHGLGLAHVCPVNGTKLMEPFINVSFEGIQFDDIYTIQRLYGDYLEVHGSERDNDTLANASAIALPLNTNVQSNWLGIDDNTDTDFFAVDLPAGSQLTVRVIPSSETYLEGEQTQSGCTAGTLFDSSQLHNLDFTIIGPDEVTVIADASSAAIGETEEVINVPTNTAGTYYIQVSGDSTNANQLYRLELEASTPSVAIQLLSTTLIDELFQGLNTVPDPGETILLQIALENVGQVGATNLNATLTGPGGFQAFDVSHLYGAIAASGNSNGNFTFALNGQCGETLNLQLGLTADGGYSANIPIQVTLGQEVTLLSENFDGSSSLPVNWTNALTGVGSGWSVVTTVVNSSPNAVFAIDAEPEGSSTLTTPTIAMGSTSGRLEFSHYYITELDWDGGVVEMSINGGSWSDVIDAGGVFVSGSYNSTLGSGTPNPLQGRLAWAGNSGGFIQTVIELPASVINQDVRFRWIMGHDRFVDGTGWFIDDISVISYSCDASEPRLALSSADTSTAEYFSATDTAEVTATAPLPLASNATVTLDSTGTADAANDLSGFASFDVLTGNTEATLTFTAVNDEAVEGSESFTLTSPEATGAILFNIADSPYGDWAAMTFGIVGAVNPDDDFDLDGFSNVEELVYGADANSATSLPDRSLIPMGNILKLQVPLASLPADVSVDAETSVDLSTWLPDNFTEVSDGFELQNFTPRRFLRLSIDVQDAALAP